MRCVGTEPHLAAALPWCPCCAPASCHQPGDTLGAAPSQRGLQGASMFERAIPGLGRSRGEHKERLHEAALDNWCILRKAVSLFVSFHFSL